VAAIGNAKCVKLLIDAGADINLQDKEGETQQQQQQQQQHQQHQQQQQC
jgi:ankyrin repeat protein